MMRQHGIATDDERGFTLIEMMVVVLIIGILIAVALPTFLSARNAASNRAAESDLRNAFTAARTCFEDHEAYVWTQPPPAASCDVVTLKAIEPSLLFNPGPSTISDGYVSVPNGPTNPSVWGAAKMSRSGICYYITAVESGPSVGVLHNSGTGACTAAQALTYTTDGTW